MPKGYARENLDPKLLAHLYWIDGLSINKMSIHLSETVHQIRSDFKKYGIPILPVKTRNYDRQKIFCMFQGCSEVASSGRRCDAHHELHEKARVRKYYYEGPETIKGEGQWIIKGMVDKKSGTIKKLWDKTIGGSDADYLAAVLATQDNGCILAGNSKSGISGDKTDSASGNKNFNWDIWL